MLRKLLLAVVASLALTAPASAQWAPKGPITLQIGFGAGGETDTLGRIIASVMEEQTGWQVVAENKPGGGGVAMASGLAHAPADGSVIGLGVTVPVMINLVLRGDQLPFKLDSFDYLGTAARAQMAIVARADAPFDDLASLVAYSKEKGGIAASFDAKPQELITQKINATFGAKLNPLTTKSGAEQMQLLLGGQVDIAYGAGVHLPFLEKGDMKIIASVNRTRQAYAPNVPTLIEQGLDLYTDPFFYFMAPAGLADDVKEALATALANAVASEKAEKVIKEGLSAEPVTLGPADTRQMMVDGVEAVGRLFAN
ncbi:MAG: tripartite tricarboxylate transporter substrate binding protein [Nitratireductor sp.]|nr:tripartite tricarboxylate transporter substrate binding protein [Nitratireductor sp.]